MRTVPKRAPLLPLALALGTVAVLDGARLPGQRSSPRPAGPHIEIVDGVEAAAGEVLVRFRTGARPESLDHTLGLAADEEAVRGIRRLRSRSLSARQLLQILSGRTDVEYVEPNYVLRVAAVPNDPDFPRQWALRNLQFPGADIRATGAWDITQGTDANVVAVIDSGIDYAHPDLRANLWRAPTSFRVRVGAVFLTCPAGTHGYDALFNSCDPIDWHGHGTAVSGPIGAVGNNGVGITGVNWRTSIMPVKFIDRDGTGTLFNAIRGIEFALNVREYFASTGAANVRVLNNSWGGGGFSQAMLEMIQRTYEQDVLFVAAAGNSNRDNDVQPFYPASYDVPNVVAVAATQEADQRAGYSNYGERTVHLGAPDWGWTTDRDGRYLDARGTSLASAVVSGAAALVLAECDLNVVQLRHVLLDTVDPLSTLRGRTATGGRLNVERAIHACAGHNLAPFVTLTSPSHGDRFFVGQTATLTLAAEAWDRDGTIARVDFFANGRLVGSATAAPYEVAWGLPLSAGWYTLSVAATDNSGATAWSTVEIRVEWPPANLPAPWESVTFGSDTSGHAAYDNGTFRLWGEGDIWRTEDVGQYVYQPLHGDGQIVARVASVEHVHDWTKAGVMIRETLDPGAPHAFMLVSGERGLAFQRRRTPGGASTHTSGGPGMAPSWVKLVRSGQTISAFRSADGAAWQLVGSDTFAMAPSAYVGLAVSSHSHELATALFDNVSMHQPIPRLPEGWSSRDIGPVTLAGSAAESGGTFTLRGAGWDIWGSTDAFHFAFRPLTGDAEIVARVATLQAGHHWAKAGVMMRESPAPASRHALMLVSAGRGLAFQRRVSTNGLTTHTSGGEGPTPQWVRLVRAGDTFSAYGSADGAHWTLVGQETISMETTIQVGLALTSHDGGALATATFDNVRVVEADPPPAAWRNQDVGVVGRAGGAWEQSGVFTLDGSGADIWNTADGFHFVYRPFTGDGEVVARVASLEAGHHWAKAGVMIRETLSAGSRHAFMLVSRARGLAFQRRVSTGGSSTHTDAGSGSAPQWVRLVRAGNTFSAYRSADGASWTLVGSETIDLTASVYVGLALTSHDNSALARAVFDNVSVRAADLAWASRDIGRVGAAGRAEESGGVVTVRGSGADIWSTADGFHFLSRPLSGDGQIVARVTNLDHTHHWAKAGVMFRESPTAGSRHAFMLVSAARGMAFQRRLTTSGESTHTAGSGAAAPHWVRLVRSGQTFTAYESANGVAWVLVGRETIAMGASIHVGLAVTSHRDGVLATATFDNVRVE